MPVSPINNSGNPLNPDYKCHRGSFSISKSVRETGRDLKNAIGGEIRKARSDLFPTLVKYRLENQDSLY